MDLNRRDFLKLSILTAGAIALTSVLDSPLGVISTGITEKGPKTSPSKKGFLNENFFPLEEEDGGFLKSSSFSIFISIIKQIDDTIKFDTGNSLDFRNNCFYFPAGFKYRNIPEFLNLLKNKINNPAINKAVDFIKEDYLKRAYYTLQAGNGSKYEKMYIENALKLFTVYSLFNGESDEKTIQKKFMDLSTLNIDDGEVKNEIYNSIEAIESRIDIKTGSTKKWTLSPEKYSKIERTLKTNPETAIQLLETDIHTHIDGINIENGGNLKKLISVNLRTKFKVFTILYGQETEEKTKDFLQELISNIQLMFQESELIKSEKFEKKLSGFIYNRVDHNIQIALKRDFEKLLFYTMTKDIANQERLRKIGAKSTLLYDLKGEIGSTLAISYLFTHCERNRAKTVLKKVGKGDDFDYKKIIASLPEKNQKELNEFEEKLNKLFNSDNFKKIRGLITNGQFEEARKEVEKLKEEEKLNTLYIIFSSIGNVVFSKIIDGGLDDENFQISRLKKTKDKYNCMTTSVLGNHIIEKVFGFKGYGVVLFRDINGERNHLLNGIKVGNKILCIDITSNMYYIKNMDEIGKDFIFEIDDFANSYLNGAYDNIRIANEDKMFGGPQNILIKKLLDENFSGNLILSRTVIKHFDRKKQK